jgi:uncharacterized membrane protein YfcA
MDGTVLDLTLFLDATFVSAIVAGLAGFAFRLVAAAVWLHILTPLQTATLIIGFGLVVQGYAVWTLRRAIDWNRLWPFLLGAALGVPLGVFMLGFANRCIPYGRGVVLISTKTGLPAAVGQARRAAMTLRWGFSMACWAGSAGLPASWS